MPSVDYPTATNMLITSPDWVFTDALLSVPNSDLTVVIHKTACGGPCSAESVARDFANSAAHKSAHFVIGRDGVVVQVVLLKDGAGANCCLSAGHDPYWDRLAKIYTWNGRIQMNICTISLEFVDWTTDNTQPMTQEQIIAGMALCKWLSVRYKLPYEQFKGHGTLDPVSRGRDPGATFPWSMLKAVIEGDTRVFSDGLCIVIWESFFRQQGISIPRRDTGIMNSWRKRWKDDGEFLGCPLTDEYPLTLPNGHKGVGQNFATTTCVWDSVTSTPFWL